LRTESSLGKEDPMLAALTGAGLSAAAGLNAYIPLVIVGTLARFTDLIELPHGLTWLSSWPSIIIFSVLLLVEIVLDKIPGVDHVNDIIQTAVRPVVGAVIFAATAAADVVESSQFWKDNEWLGYVLGAIMASIVHIGKATSRTAINAATAGVGSPVASVAEDGVAVGLSFSAILVPWLVALILLAMGAAVYRIVTTGRRRRERKAAEQAEDRAAREARERESEPWWRLFARSKED
jgi:uncharacterized membrane protein